MAFSIRTGNALACIATLATALSVACGDSTNPVYPAGVDIAPADTTIVQGTSFPLRVTVTDSGGNPIPLRPTLMSSDSAILTVTSQGVGRSVGPAGSAVITATLGPFTDYATVTVRDSTLVARLPIAGGPLGVAVSGDIAYVSRTSSNKLQRLNLATTSVTDSVAAGSLPCFVVFNAAGTRAYVANQFSQNVSIINVTTNTQIGVIPLNGDPLPVVISNDGGTLFATTNVNRLYKIDLSSNTVVDSLGLLATSHHLLMHPNDTLLYVASRDGGTVVEVNWRAMTVARVFTLGGRTQGMAISPNRQELYVANETGNVLHIVTLATGASTSIALAGGGEGLALSGDGTKLYVGLVFDGKVQVIDRVARTVIRTVVTGGTPREIATDAARQHVLVANEGGWVDILR